MTAGTTNLVSRADGKNGAAADEDSHNPAITDSAAGPLVVFDTRATNLGANGVLLRTVATTPPSRSPARPATARTLVRRDSFEPDIKVVPGDKGRCPSTENPSQAAVHPRRVRIARPVDLPVRPFHRLARDSRRAGRRGRGHPCDDVQMLQRAQHRGQRVDRQPGRAQAGLQRRRPGRRVPQLGDEPRRDRPGRGHPGLGARARRPDAASEPRQRPQRRRPPTGTSSPSRSAARSPTSRRSPDCARSSRRRRRTSAAPAARPTCATSTRPRRRRRRWSAAPAAPTGAEGNGPSATPPAISADGSVALFDTQRDEPRRRPGRSLRRSPRAPARTLRQDVELVSRPERRRRAHAERHRRQLVRLLAQGRQRERPLRRVRLAVPLAVADRRQRLDERVRPRPADEHHRPRQPGDRRQRRSRRRVLERRRHQRGRPPGRLHSSAAQPRSRRERRASGVRARPRREHDDAGQPHAGRRRGAAPAPRPRRSAPTATPSS